MGKEFEQLGQDDADMTPIPSSDVRPIVPVQQALFLEEKADIAHQVELFLLRTSNMNNMQKKAAFQELQREDAAVARAVQQQMMARNKVSNEVARAGIEASIESRENARAVTKIMVDAQVRVAGVMTGNNRRSA